jgi:hypothetical protein
VRQRGGKIDLAEDRSLARAEALRRTDQNRVDPSKLKTLPPDFAA